jgi:trehalose/maltose transport system substrate-binding protein
MRTLIALGALLFALCGCASDATDKPKQQVVITYIGSSAPGFAFDDATLQQFTNQTGIKVRFIPGPELIGDQLVHYQKLLKDHASTPDVYFVDVVWPGILGSNFLDLTKEFGDEAAEFFPALIENDTVGGKLVAVPTMMEVGLLYYRRDLLAKYGFTAPPRTWDELERMAKVIQEGERRAGNRDFWGYVWQGAPAEGLTCVALEWQASEGGGVIIDKATRSITVNNPDAARALKRAAHWVGSITPTTVLNYSEEDASNVWIAGNAAFFRGWSLASRKTMQPDSPIRDKFGITSIPGGKGGHAGTLGGWQLAVSPYSQHTAEALKFVRYVTGSDVQLYRAKTTLYMPTRPRLYAHPEIETITSRYPPLLAAKEGATIVRPSAAAGNKYQEISAAYYRMVHRILAGDVTAEAGLRDLEQQLVTLTGMPARVPERARGVKAE